MLLFSRMLFRHKHTFQSHDVRPGDSGVSGTSGAFTNGFLGHDAGLIPQGAGIGERTPRPALVLSLVVVLAFVLLITLPFAGQAFHIDDAIFWDFARQTLETPFQQHLHDYQLMGVDFPEFRDTHPPLDQLYLAAIMRVTGSHSELPLHLGFIIFPVTAGLSMFY